jgi:hypothetical protein
MNDEKIVTWWYETYSATGGRVLNEVDMPAEVAEAIDRGEAAPTFRPLAHRRFEGEEAQARIQALLDEIST